MSSPPRSTSWLLAALGLTLVILAGGAGCSTGAKDLGVACANDDECGSGVCNAPAAYRTEPVGVCLIDCDENRGCPGESRCFEALRFEQRCVPQNTVQATIPCGSSAAQQDPADDDEQQFLRPAQEMTPMPSPTPADSPTPAVSPGPGPGPDPTPEPEPEPEPQRRLCPSGMTCLDVQVGAAVRSQCFPNCPGGRCRGCTDDPTVCGAEESCLLVNQPRAMCFPDAFSDHIEGTSALWPCGRRAVMDADGSCVGGIPCDPNRSDEQCPLQNCLDGTAARGCGVDGYCRSACVACQEASCEPADAN